MIKFQEPGEEYDLKKINKADHSKKVNTITMFTILLLLVAFLLKNDFNYNLIKTRAVVINEVCSPRDAYNWNDEKEVFMDKANSVLEKNVDQFKAVRGFENAFVESEPIGYQGKELPVLNVVFDETSDGDVKDPTRICGYRTKIVFK